MKDASADDILERMLKAIGSTTDNVLAKALGVSPQSISDARRKQKVPPAWAITLAAKYQVSLDWLVFGLGPMRPGDALEAPPVPKGTVVSMDLVYDVVEALEEHLQANRLMPDPSLKAEIVRQLCMMVIEHEQKEERVRPGQMLRLIRNALASNDG